MIDGDCLDQRSSLFKACKKTEKLPPQAPPAFAHGWRIYKPAPHRRSGRFVQNHDTKLNSGADITVQDCNPEDQHHQKDEQYTLRPNFDNLQTVHNQESSAGRMPMIDSQDLRRIWKCGSESQPTGDENARHLL